MVTIKDIEKLSELSRLDIPEDEKQGFVEDLESVLGLIDQIQKAVTDSGKDEKDLSPHRNIMRDDIDPHKTSEYTESIVANIPDSHDGYLKVKKILN